MSPGALQSVANYYPAVMNVKIGEVKIWTVCFPFCSLNWPSIFKRCYSCGDNHKCHKRCERVLFCGHICNEECHGNSPCGKCINSCETKCPHSSCHKMCSNLVSMYELSFIIDCQDLFVKVFTLWSHILDSVFTMHWTLYLGLWTFWKMSTCMWCTLYKATMSKGM